MTQRIVTLAALAALTLGALTDRSAPAGEKTRGLTDQQFVERASAMDLAEIKLGKIALKNAAGPEAKQFARRMIADHTKSSMELLKIAGPKGLQPSEQPDNKHQALASKMATMKGAAFDRAYLKHMVMDHQKAVSLYQAQARRGQDQDIKAFAAKTLPVVREHLKMARELAGKEGSGEGH